MAGKASATEQALAPPTTFTPLPTHALTSVETGAYPVEKIANDGTMVVTDPTTGGKQMLRLGVNMIGGQPVLIAVGDS